MNSPALQVDASPTWGPARRRRRGPAAAPRRVRFGTRASALSDATGVVVVLGGAVALWAGVLLAVW